MDVYCERTSDAFWSEPLNAWTNVAFLLAAMLLLPRLWAIEGRPEGRRFATPGRVLLVEMVAIALGSFAFHTFANPLAAMADVGSIAVFILTFVGVYLRRALGMGLGWSIAAVAAVLIASVGLPGLVVPMLPTPQLGFIPTYLPATAAAAGLGVAAMRRGLTGGGYLLGTAGVFVLSMAVASLDMPLCPWWPWGTHFVWHVLNAVVLYLAVRGFFAAAGKIPRPVGVKDAVR